MGSKLIVSTEYKSYNKTNFATCEKLCVEDPKCISLHHNSENNECQLSKSSVPAPSACENCTYYVRHCSPGTHQNIVNNVYLTRLYFHNHALLDSISKHRYVWVQYSSLLLFWRQRFLARLSKNEAIKCVRDILRVLPF